MWPCSTDWHLPQGHHGQVCGLYTAQCKGEPFTQCPLDCETWDSSSPRLLFPPPTPCHHMLYGHHFQDTRYLSLPFIYSGPFLRKIFLYLLHPQSLILSRPSSNSSVLQRSFWLPRRMCSFTLSLPLPPLLWYCFANFPSEHLGDKNLMSYSFWLAQNW